MMIVVLILLILLIRRMYSQPYGHLYSSISIYYFLGHFQHCCLLAQRQYG